MMAAGSFHATRTTGTVSVCEIACSIGQRLAMSVRPCCMSTTSASKPCRAITSAVKPLETESQPIVTHRFSRQSCLILFARMVSISSLSPQSRTCGYRCTALRCAERVSSPPRPRWCKGGGDERTTRFLGEARQALQPDEQARREERHPLWLSMGRLAGARRPTVCGGPTTRERPVGRRGQGAGDQVPGDGHH